MTATHTPSALRRLERPGKALEAARHAVAIDPRNPSSRLERGLARWALGDAEGAHLDLGETVRLFDGTPAAEAALAELGKTPPAPAPDPSLPPVPRRCGYSGSGPV